MGNDVKVLIGEINGQELDQQEEYILQFDDLPTVDTSTTPPNVGDKLEWNGTHWVPAADVANGEEHQAFFFGQGSIGNKWISLGASPKTSDDIPYTIIDDVEISAISWTNGSSTLDVDIEIYKNGTTPGDKIATIPIINKKTMAKSDITPIACNHGDRLSIFIKRNGGTNATDPVVTLYLQVTTATSSEVST